MISKWIFRKVEQSWNIDDVSVIDAREMEQKKKKKIKKEKTKKRVACCFSFLFYPRAFMKLDIRFVSSLNNR